MTPVENIGPDYTTADFQDGGSEIVCHLTNANGVYSTFTVTLNERVWHESDTFDYETCVGSTADGNDPRDPFQGTIHNLYVTQHVYDAATHQSDVLTGAQCNNDCPICPAHLGGECIEDLDTAVIFNLKAGSSNGTTPGEYHSTIEDSGPNHLDITLADLHNRNPNAAGLTGSDPVYVGCQGVLFDGQAYLRTSTPYDMAYQNSFTVEAQFKPTLATQTSTFFAIENADLAFQD